MFRALLRLPANTKLSTFAVRAMGGSPSIPKERLKGKVAIVTASTEGLVYLPFILLNLSMIHHPVCL